MQRPIRKLILHAHGVGHPSESFTIPSQMVIKYFGEFGKSCSIETKFPARRICSSMDIVPRTASRVNRAYFEEELPPSMTAGPLACNEEGCSFSSSNRNILTRHIHARHVPRGSLNDLSALERSLRASRKNRGYILNPAKNAEQYMLFSPRITQARSHPGNTVFPNLFIGTDEHNKKNSGRVYRTTTLEECDGSSARVLLYLEDYINSKGQLRHGVQHPFTTMESGSRLLLSHIVAYINELYAGERIDLYIIMCLDAIPEATIKLVEDSVQKAERPWRGLMNLGRVASSVPYQRPNRARSRSANRRNRNTRRQSPATGWRYSNSRPAARPHAKGG